MNQIPIYFKSDFKVILESETGWTVPFLLKFWTNAPSRAYKVCYDGKKYCGCHLENDGRLCIAFDDHGLGLGKLVCQPTFFLNDECYRSGVCDEVLKPFDVVVSETKIVKENFCVGGLMVDSGFLTIAYEPEKNTSTPVFLDAGDEVTVFAYGNMECALCVCEKYEEGSAVRTVARVGDLLSYTFKATEDCVIFLTNAFPYDSCSYEMDQKVESNIILSLTGASTLETHGTLPAYYMKGDKGEPGLTPEEYEAVIEATENANDAAEAARHNIADVKELKENKVDKVPGKGLSEQDFTTALKEKLEGLSNYDDTEIREEIEGKAGKSEVSQLDLKMGELESAVKAEVKEIDGKNWLVIDNIVN